MRSTEQLGASNNWLQSGAAVVEVPSLARESGGENFMAQHRSLKGASALGAKRNVLKRFERVELLKKRGQWKEGDRVTGLRKTKGEA
jgi:small basic protein (TIGR04137 family)